MPRSSRHRSHRSRKHSRERSDSEEEESPRGRRTREDAGRVSRDPEPEKRRSSHENAGKELGRSSNGDISGEKKRKEREEEVVVVADRWNGGKDNDEKRSKGEELGPMDLDRSSKSKTTDSKGRPSRRNEGPNERDDDYGGKNDSIKGKPEKDSSRRESSSQYKDVKDRESEKNSEVQDPRHGKSDDLLGRKHGPRVGSSTEEHTMKKYTKINGERQPQDVFPGAEIEKAPEKHSKRRDESEEKDKRLDDSRDFDDRRQSCRDHSRNRSYKDEKNENTKYKGKYRMDNDRDQNHRDDKYQDEWSSKDHVGDKSDKCHFRDENKTLESHNKKIKETDQDGTCVVDTDNKPKDSRGRKRYYNDKDDNSDLKLRGAKEQRETEKNISVANRTSSHNIKPRSGYQHKENADSSPRNNRLKASTSSSTYAGNDDNRDISKLDESVHRVSAPEERSRSITVPKGDSLASSGLRDRNSTTRSGKQTLKDDFHSGDFLVEAAASSRYDRISRSDTRTSPNQSRGRSPSAHSGRRLSDRSPAKYDRAVARQGLDTEIGQKSGSYRDGDRRELASEKPIPDGISQTDARIRESTPIGSSSINRGGFSSDRSPNRLRPPPVSRHGIDNASVLGPYQDDSRAPNTDRRSYNRNKRTGDLGYGRGQGNVWQGAPNWSSPPTNGFIPMQHGPPPAGFHHTMSQFPPPPLFGVRPMDLTHGAVSYHMHDMAERFPGHGQPFGWRNSVDQLCHPQMPMWDRGNGMYSNESHVFGRQEWDENGQLMGSKGWEMSSEMWKVQKGNNLDDSLFTKEMESSKQSPTDDLVQSKCLPTENIETKRSSDTHTSKNNAKSPQVSVTKKTLEPSNKPEDQIANYFLNYLSRIDISPDLAGSELYKTCASKLETFGDDVCNSIAYGCFQMKSDGIVKMKSTCSLLKSFFPAENEGLFKRALSLYQKRSGRVDGKHAATSPTIYSGQVKKASPQSSENKTVLGGTEEQASLEIPLSPADPANDADAGNSTVVQGKEIEIVVEHCNDHEASDALMEDSRPSLSRIHNSDENTH